MHSPSDILVIDDDASSAEAARPRVRVPYFRG